MSSLSQEPAMPTLLTGFFLASLWLAVLGGLTWPAVVLAAGEEAVARRLLNSQGCKACHPFEAQGEFPDMVVDVYCNGVPQRFIRGVPVQVKRKFVEVLANARIQNMKTNVVREGDNVYNRVDKHTSLRYPFQMIDSNPRGNAWLRGLMGKSS
jgi:hypothetical protein